MTKLTKCKPGPASPFSRQQGLKTFVDIPPAPDIVDLQEALVIVDLVNDAIAFCPVRTKT
jgi:hypothetical protein